MLLGTWYVHYPCALREPNLGLQGVASKLIANSAPRDTDGNVINLLDAQFRSLQTNMVPINKSSSEFAALRTYANDTHGANPGFGVQIECAFRVDRWHLFFISACRSRTQGYRQEEAQKWDASPACSKLGGGDRLLLWHGSRSTNFVGILKQGLRIAPPEGEESHDLFSIPIVDTDIQPPSPVRFPKV